MITSLLISNSEAPFQNHVAFFYKIARGWVVL
jgi:hypothetical protein